MSSCFILPTDFNKESLISSLKDIIQADPSKEYQNEASFNVNSPSLFSDELPNLSNYVEKDSGNELFLTFSTNSTRLQKDSKDQINKIKADWDALNKMKEESTNINSDVEVRIKYNRGPMASLPWNQNNRIKVEKLNEKNEYNAQENKNEQCTQENVIEEEEEENEPNKDEPKPSFYESDDDENYLTTTNNIQDDQYNVSMRIFQSSVRKITNDDSDSDFESD